jgi:hypothetical protein
MTSFGLSLQQCRFLDTFGYLHLRGLLADAIDGIATGFERLLAENGGEAYAGQHRFTISPGINWSEGLCRDFLDAPQVDDVLSSVLGPDYQYWNSELNYCSGDTPWHTDSPWPEDRRTPSWYELLLYLDPLTAETGALRVIPGSHHVRDGFANLIQRGIIDETASALVDPSHAWAVSGPDVPAVALPSEPGDVILLNHMTAHASFGGVARRRLMTAVFFPRLDDAAVQQLIDTNRRRGFTRSRLFDDAPILRTASPRRLSHLDQMLAHTPDDRDVLRNLLGLSKVAPTG